VSSPSSDVDLLCCFSLWVHLSSLPKWPCFRGFSCSLDLAWPHVNMSLSHCRDNATHHCSLGSGQLLGPTHLGSLPQPSAPYNLVSIHMLILISVLQWPDIAHFGFFHMEFLPPHYGLHCFRICLQMRGLHFVLTLLEGNHHGLHFFLAGLCHFSPGSQS
jgi:hypothetical protein